MARKPLTWTVGAALAAVLFGLFSLVQAHANPVTPTLTAGFSEPCCVSATSLTVLVAGNTTGSFTEGPNGQGTDCAASISASTYGAAGVLTEPDLLTGTVDVSCGLVAAAGTKEDFDLFISASNLTLSTTKGMPYVPYNTVLPLKVQNGATSLSMLSTTGNPTGGPAVNQSVTESLVIDPGDCYYWTEQAGTTGCTSTPVPGSTYNTSGAGTAGSPNVIAATVSIDNVIFESSAAACAAALPTAPAGTDCIVDTTGMFDETLEYQISVTADGTNDQSVFSSTFDLTWPPEAVPEPSSMALLGAGLFALGWFRRGKKAA